jgi:hypothetical protein
MASTQTSSNREKVIDLQLFTPAGVTVLETRPWGISARRRSKIDQLASTYETIIIKVPSRVSRINPLFLEEFFENAFTTYGWEGFTKKFCFVFRHHLRLDADLAEAATRVLHDSKIYYSKLRVQTRECVGAEED